MKRKRASEVIENHPYHNGTGEGIIYYSWQQNKSILSLRTSLREVRQSQLYSKKSRFLYNIALKGISSHLSYKRRLYSKILSTSVYTYDNLRFNPTLRLPRHFVPRKDNCFVLSIQISIASQVEIYFLENNFRVGKFTTESFLSLWDQFH